MSGIKDTFKDNKKIFLLMGALIIAVIAGFYLTQDNGLLNTNSNLESLTTAKYSAPEQVLESGVDYQAILKTSAGNITIDLFEDQTPKTVNSFLFLVGKNFYDNITFHRVVKNFVIQTGDPTGTGNGGPGYYINDEITSTKFGPYMVGMANAGSNTNGSQFFITSGNISEANIEALNGKYTVFGRVLSGFSVVDSIEKVTTDSKEKPVNDVKLYSIQIIEN